MSIVRPIRREVVAVPLKSQDLTVHVRSLSALESIEMQERLRGAEGTTKLVAVQLSFFVCDESGEQPLLTEESALAFIQSINSADLQALMKRGQAANAIDDEALEKAEKN